MATQKKKPPIIEEIKAPYKIEVLKEKQLLTFSVLGSYRNYNEVFCFKGLTNVNRLVRGLLEFNKQKENKAISPSDYSNIKTLDSKCPVNIFWNTNSRLRFEHKRWGHVGEIPVDSSRTLIKDLLLNAQLLY